MAHLSPLLFCLIGVTWLSIASLMTIVVLTIIVIGPYKVVVGYWPVRSLP